MNTVAEKFDRWVRSSFVEMNTALEEIYFARADKADVTNKGSGIKQALEKEGSALIAPLVAEGNTERRFDAAFDVLGNLGLYMGALRRHEMTNPDRDTQSPFRNCSALGMHIAASIGVVPRFATAHLTTHNRAVNGVPKSFTRLRDEKLFLEYNLLGILGYKRAGVALMRIPSMGISSPGAEYMLKEALEAIEGIIGHNKLLYDKLDVERFFYCVRPYYKPYRVGKQVYRGANAGDFAEINQIDLLLGLCRGNDSRYAQILEEKMLFMMPEDQRSLRRAMGVRPLLDAFLDDMAAHKHEAWFKKNAALFLDVCTAHGRSAAQHHNMLVRKFIEGPSKGTDTSFLKQVTASGAPLPVLIETLRDLRDLRTAAPRADLETAHAKLESLRHALRA